MADTITLRPDEDTTKAIRAEAARLAADESDRAEAVQVLRDMETLRAW